MRRRLSSDSDVQMTAGFCACPVKLYVTNTTTDERIGTERASAWFPARMVRSLRIPLLTKRQRGRGSSQRESLLPELVRTILVHLGQVRLLPAEEFDDLWRGKISASDMTSSSPASTYTNSKKELWGSKYRSASWRGSSRLFWLTSDIIAIRRSVKTMLFRRSRNNLRMAKVCRGL